MAVAFFADLCYFQQYISRLQPGSDRQFAKMKSVYYEVFPKVTK